MRLPKIEKVSVVSALKWVGGVAVGLAVLLAIIIIGSLHAFKVWWTPERLTLLIEEYAPNFINGKVDLGHVDVTFRETFPDLTIEIDSLVLMSNALENVPVEIKAQLPEWSDTVLTLSRFKGTVNLNKLKNKELALYDVVLEHPSVNLLAVNDSLANYDIIPPSDEESALDIRTFSLDKFRLTSSGPLRYYSLADSLQIEAQLKAFEVDGSNNPQYGISTSGGVVASMLDIFGIPELTFAFNGGVTLDDNAGCKQLTIDDFLLSTGDMDLNLSTSVDFGDTIVVRSLKADIPSLSYNTIKHYLSADADMELPNLNTDAALSLSVNLTQPYTYLPESPAIPSAIVTLNVPQSYIRWPQHYLNINRFILESKLTLDGENLNNSVLEIPKLFIDGHAMDIDFRGLVSRPLSDPKVAGEIKGRLILEQLPSILLSKLPGKVTGTIGMNTAFRFKKSQLTPNGFHNIYLNGVVSLRELSAQLAGYNEETGTTDSLEIYTPLTMLRFDSNKSIESNGVTIDSMLSLTLTSDSLLYKGEGMELRLKNLKAGLGSKNMASSSDTTKINPFGGGISIERLSLNSYIDKTRLIAADLTGSGSFTRFEGLERVPLLNINLGARMIATGTPSAGIMIGSPKFTVTANINPRSPRRTRFHRDSTATDSTVRHRHERRRELTPEDSAAMGIRNLLRRWNVKGELTASRGRLFTSAFPLSNTFSDVDLYFTTDSIQLRSLKLKAGESDFSIRGAITGIKESMRRNSRNPVKIRFSLQSDTLNIDELSRAVFAGAAAQPDTTIWDSGIDVHTDVADVVKVDTTETGAFLVPAELDAALRFKAKNVIYTGLLLHDFKGTLDAWDSAIHLHDLQATSDMGNIEVTALYNAPDPENLDFGMGMELKDFHLEKFLQVTPAIGELLPSIKDFSGIINADIAMTTRLEPNMDFEIPSVKADIKITGDSLVLLDADTFKSLSKWLFFKNKKRNMIDHMGIELQVDSGQIIIYPFIFNIDRYKLGVMGSNDLDMNLNYHVSVLKSPIPFKFGINITGNIDKMKIRLGGAKIKENTVVERLTVNSDTRINLIRQLEGIFRRGANSARGGNIHLNHDHGDLQELRNELGADTDTLSTEHLELLESEPLNQ